MPGKSNSEKIDELLTRVIKMSADLDNLEEKHQAEADSLHDDIRQVRDTLGAAVRDNAVLREQITALQLRCTQLEKQNEEGERRRWQIVIAVLSGFFTALMALVVAMLKK